MINGSDKEKMLADLKYKYKISDSVREKQLLRKKISRLEIELKKEQNNK